ncbi:DUF1573 domain-containing protein [Sediminibacterium soli]|uniref:DUF1573 domain-containing protein n=1 Tax=Sediminibacterium soli TaxID=2698829 RepID=UPI00137A07C5|nr:DUF1573 domain-containing protein [Sediminibacterium soli]NCI46247.1 DUF1573 domain-containing protein [Sediminibacterium soli]
MRTLLFFLVAATLIAACSQQAGNDAAVKIMEDTARYTTIQWQDSVVHFDTLDQGNQTTVVFKFRNTGTQPLILADVKAGCGCTVAEYTKEAVPPGGEGVVKGLFDSNRAQAGEVRKNILVTSNTRNGTRHTLIFTGFIREKKHS